MAAPGPALLDRVEAALRAVFPPGAGTALHRGATWTTDAPYRETAAAIAHARACGALAVEMEASALYTLAASFGRKALAICTVSDHVVTGEETTAHEREQTFGTMVEIALEAALGRGVTAYEPGLLAAANRGILYVDEVNLLHDHLVDLLLDAAATGRSTVEREGVSVSHASRIVLIGTMNPEEGELRPQLLDRFGLTVEVAAPRDPALRAAAGSS